MDIVKATDLENKLRGKAIDGWTIEQYINHGKSAAVFRARQGDNLAALKIFDDELIKRYGDATQFKRIERELQLQGHNHPNMVPILGGGIDEQTQNHFIIMKYINGPNLAECLKDIPVDSISLLAHQLASAAKFLEDHQLCHRDIKPENIAIDKETENLILLDFGVVRPFGEAGLTDGDLFRAFVGTLRYSSPEFLLRQEEDTEAGWRALTFYQIGGVMHDLIMKKPLFSEFSEPYAVLVNAVQFEQPKIQSSSTPNHVIELATRCLLKDWKVRERLVTWEQFSTLVQAENITTSAKQRVTNRAVLARAQKVQESKTLTVAVSSPKPTVILADTLTFLKTSIKSIRNDNTIFPPAKITMLGSSKDSLVVYFDSHHELGWANPVRFYFSVAVLEALSRAVSIKGCAYEGLNEPNLRDWQPSDLFAGVYNSTAIREYLESFMYSIVDQIQQSPSTITGRWLNVQSE